MKKSTRIIDVGFVGALLMLVAAPLFAVTAPALGEAARYTILDVNTPNAMTARVDAQNAYNQLLTMQCTTDMGRQDLNNQRLYPGVYCFTGNHDFNGQVLLDAKGDPNAVFIFKMSAVFTVWPDSRVVLVGGAQAQNVFWAVGGKVIIGTSADFAGTIIAFDSITFGRGGENPVFDEHGSVNGRLWSIGSTVTVPSQVAVGFQSVPVIVPVATVVQQPVSAQQISPVGWLTIMNSDPNFMFFVNGYRVMPGQQYPFASGTYTVNEINVSNLEYGNPVWGGACTQNGLNGIVTIAVNEQKICTVTNTPFAYSYGGTVAYAPSTNMPTLPNTGGGGAYLPFLNAAGMMLVMAFIAEEFLASRRIRKSQVTPVGMCAR